MELSDFCVQVGIELIALYPNATHILQPMDVAVFHPLKCGWKKGVHKYKVENDGQKLKRDHFAPLLKSVIDEYISSETIKNGFKICGLFPLDPGAVPYQKYFKITAEKQISMKPQAFHTQQNLDFLEKELGEEKLRKFKEEQNEKWAGNIEDTSLYKLWKKIYDAVHVKLDENEPPQNFIEDSEIDGGLDFTGETETQERSLGDISEPIFSNNMPSPNPLCQDNLGITHTTPPKIVILDNTLLNPPVNENNLCDLSIPSPFKSTLFWPKPAPTKTKKRCKEKIPTVATSDQWRQYYVKKQIAKEKMEKEKQERKIKREEKKKEREEKQNKKRMEIYENDSSDSSVDMILESEGEGDDWGEMSEDNLQLSFNKDVLEVDSFVIVNYDGKHYPGRILAVNHEGEYEISAMAPSGKDWKWPITEDRMWYKNNDVIATIDIPKSKNKRGVFVIPEMEKYSNIYYC